MYIFIESLSLDPYLSRDNVIAAIINFSLFRIFDTNSRLDTEESTYTRKHLFRSEIISREQEDHDLKSLEIYRIFVNLYSLHYM